MNPAHTPKLSHGLVAMLLLLPSFAGAQPKPAPASAASSDESAIKLDVFTVKENTARAYGSSNLASATRLTTAAENVPQSISTL